MAEVYTGVVQGASKVTVGTPNTPVAFCRTVIGGSFTLDPHNVQKRGVGGQVHTRKGTTEATLELRCVGVSKADMQLWFPTTAGVQVASFPDFLVEADDGSGGKEWLLEEGQPATFSGELAEGDDAEFEVVVTAKFAKATEQVIGTDVPVYNSVLGHTRNDIKVGFGATPDYHGVLSFSLANDLGIRSFNPADLKTGAKTMPDGYVLTRYDPRLSAVTSEPFEGLDFDQDVWTAKNVAIVMANGTAGEDITITLSSFVPGPWNMPLEPEEVVGFGHEWTMGDGVTYNRVVFS